MNRRQMVILPGIALAATRGFAQTETPGITRTGLGGPSRKSIAKYGRVKASYTVPKSEARQAKYVAFLTSLLSLTSGQQEQAVSIFNAARGTDAEFRKTLKSNHKSLSEAVIAGNATNIGAISTAIGTVAAQRHTVGANAHAAFYQMLTAAQQATLSQFRG